MASSKAAKAKENKTISSRKKSLPKGMSQLVNLISMLLTSSPGCRIQTRPIMHPPIPSPYTGADHQKVVYVSTGSPFIAVVKRVRKLLSLIQKRTMVKTDLIEGKGSDKQKLKSLATATAAAKEKKPETVLLKATNRAVDKALSIALFLKEQEDLRVHIMTGTVAVVDDIIPEEVPDEAAGTAEMSQDGDVGQETRVRYLNVLEVAVSMK